MEKEEADSSGVPIRKLYVANIPYNVSRGNSVQSRSRNRR